MLAAVTMPTSVLGSNVISHSDKFLSTTATLDPPSINLEVLPGTNILAHLRDGSTNTWTCFWCPVTFVSPLAITFEEQELSPSWLLPLYLSLGPSQIPGHSPVMISI